MKVGKASYKEPSHCLIDIKLGHILVQRRAPEDKSPG